MTTEQKQKLSELIDICNTIDETLEQQRDKLAYTIWKIKWVSDIEKLRRMTFIIMKSMTHSLEIMKQANQILLESAEYTLKEG